MLATVALMTRPPKEEAEYYNGIWDDDEREVVELIIYPNGDKRLARVVDGQTVETIRIKSAHASEVGRFFSEVNYSLE